MPPSPSDASAAVAAAEQGGRRPDEGDLLRLADAQQRTEQHERLPGPRWKSCVQYYPKKDYWNAYLGRLPRKAGFADRFALDLMRLKLASGTAESRPRTSWKWRSCACRPACRPRRRVAEQGFKAGALGTGPEANRHQRLRDLAVKQEGTTKAALVNQLAEAEAAKEGDGW
jgi:hypothetical protein